MGREVKVRDEVLRALEQRGTRVCIKEVWKDEVSAGSDEGDRAFGSDKPARAREELAGSGRRRRLVEETQAAVGTSGMLRLNRRRFQARARTHPSS